MAPAADERETVEPRSRAAWRAWLERRHDSSPGVWVVLVKKGRGDGLSYEAAVEEAVCFGWIDSKTQRLDDDRFRQLFTPRRRGSQWSKSNKERYERLLAAGRMAPAGLAAAEAARVDGSWTALDDVEELRVPDDLARALASNAAAQEHFSRFPASAVRGALWWVATARRPETRERRIAEIVRLAEENRRPGDSSG